MAQTREGAQKISAAHAGLSVMDYKGWRKRGYLWCTRCKGWHPKKSFGKDASRPDRNERATSCKESRHAYSKRTYIKKGRPAHSGPPPFPPRAGDKLQARQRINVLVRTGKLLHPRELPCFDCGHVWIAGQRRHEYDHYKGYDADHHYDVQAVCTLCHRRRSIERGEINLYKLKAAAAARKAGRKARCSKGHLMSYGKDGMWRCQECRREYWRERGRHRGKNN